MPEVVSGWSDDNAVWLVIRNGDEVRYRKLKAKWTAFFAGLDDGDRKTLARTKGVVALSLEPSGLTRIDFASHWARKDSLFRIGNAIKGKNLVTALSDFDPGSDDEEQMASILEGDVNPLRRLLSDHPEIQISTSPRLGWFDLETDSRAGILAARDGKARILSWALVSSEGVRESAVLAEDNDNAERELLAGFFRAAEKYDCMLAWNGDGFDFPALENRIMKLRLKMDGRFIEWRRWCWLDFMAVYKKYNQAHESGEERVSFSLDAVAKHTLGEGKLDFDAKHTWDYWAAGGEKREQLLTYNERDTELMPRIEAKTGFVALHIAVCHVTRCFPDSVSLQAGQQGDGFLLALGASRGYRFATKKFSEEENVPYSGAYVMAPKRVGVIDDVHVCDFAGLYPSIMRSFNMSPDTVVSAQDIRRLKVPYSKLPTRDVFFRTDQRGLFPLALDTLTARRAEYTKRADAADPGSAEFDHYKRLSSAYKIIANSFYGIVGSPFTRFFSREVAEGVTTTGAWLIKQVATVSERSGLEPFYGDTDSVFVQGSAEAFEQVVRELNAGWPRQLADLGCKDSFIKLEFEKSFRRLILVSAKRYAASYSRYKGKPAPMTMKPEIKGLEYKRGDTIRLARMMQEEAIKALLELGDPNPKAFHEMVDRWKARILEGELALDDVVLSQSVKGLKEYAERYTTAKCSAKIGKGKAAKSCGYDFGTTASTKETTDICPRCKTQRKVASAPAHVRVARMMQDRGEHIVAGTRIEYLVVKPEFAPRVEGEDGDADSKLVAVPARDEGMLAGIDRDYYWTLRIYPPTQRLLESVFPHDAWVPSTEEKRAAKAAERAEKKTAAIAEKKKKGDLDLPLFAGGAAVRPTKGTDHE